MLEMLRIGRRRSALMAAAAFAAGVLVAHEASADTKVSFLTSWKAQAEHGGYYQALALGYFKKHGLDVKIREGGPQLNGTQMLAGGAVDFAMLSNNDDILQAVIHGAHMKAVMAGFQKSPQILMTHEGNGIEKLEDMKGKPILLAAGSVNTMFAWLKAKYGFMDSQIRKYTFNMAPFLADKNSIQQGYLSSEPFIVKKEGGITPKVFLLADHGYNTYASITATSDKMIEEHPEVVQAFVDASIEGLYSYLYGDPSPANALIKKDNPEMTDDTIAFGMAKLKEAGIIDSGDALTMGIGAMTDARWKSQFASAASVGVYPKDFDYKKAYTLQFVDKGHGLAMKPKM